jgi:hypothetical protein
VSPRQRDHTLAFGLEHEIDHAGMSADEICAAVAAAGGIAFAAHPFSRGSEAFGGLAKPHPHAGLRSPDLTGLELWSYVTDSVERVAGIADAVRFVARPERFVDDPPERNVSEWDRLCAERRLVAIGGLDAHQVGIRVAGRVPLRAMGYARSFRHLRTHVLCHELPSGEVEHDRAQVYAALRAGRCYLAMDSIAPARGFSFWAERGRERVALGAEAHAGGWTLHARLPRPADVRLVRDGVELVREPHAATLDAPADEPGAYRVEARLTAYGRARTWVMSNPIYLR